MPYTVQGEVEEKSAVFQWRLKEFSSLDDRVGTWCKSPLFSFGGRRWYLCLFPNGLELCQSEGDIVLALWLHGSGPPIEATYSLCIRTPKGETGVCRRGTKVFDYSESSSFVSLGFMKRSELLQRRDELLPQDVLTVALEMKLGDGSSGTVLKDASVQATVETNVADASVQTVVEENESCGGKGEPSGRTGPEKIVEDVGKLWPNGDHTDVLLKVRDVEFKAHRTILVARTPVLGALFVHDTTEKASGEVSIEDCEPEVFEQLLHFIYRGAPRELTADNACALYVLADKYLVNEMKALCVCCMRDTLCLDTFCDTLTLSLMHREDELLKTATDFLSKNMTRVLKTVEWQRFMREHPTWANEVQIRAMELIEARYEALVDRSM